MEVMHIDNNLEKRPSTVSVRRGNPIKNINTFLQIDSWSWRLEVLSDG